MQYLEKLLEIFSSPSGILGLFISFCCAAIGIKYRYLLPYFLALPIFVSCFGKYRWIKESFVFPLEQILTFSRPVFVVSLALILPISLFLLPRQSRFRPHLGAWALLTFQMIYALRLVSEGDSDFGLLAIATFLLSFFSIHVLHSTLPADREYVAMNFCGAFFVAGVLFVFACLYQYGMGPSASMWSGRFIGITNNSNHTARYAVFFFLSAIPFFFLFHRRRKWWLVIPIIGVCLLLCWIILATGSRTGIVMLGVGILTMFRNRMGRLIFPTILMIGVIAYFQGDDTARFESATDHLASMDDTRSELFIELSNRFAENAVFGKMEITENGRLRVRESSYLTAAANLGLSGLVPLLCAVTFFLTLSFKVMTENRKFMGSLIFTDWCLASILAVLAGAITEGVIFSIVTPGVILMYVGFVVLGDTDRNQLIHPPFEHRTN